MGVKEVYEFGHAMGVAGGVVDSVQQVVLQPFSWCGCCEVFVDDGAALAVEVCGGLY